ncbi:hypothetical protein O181_043672 [Austropuccinia psidii MF-1]|uniref:Uncharacterized protein n=1 Tax=Austropuccinia psidii MF-1 TaxID=1389203 RepID=A0A9Q3DQA3_9BASI|nr:hypothetical protein [Austropuccinia psidii MF-1]
MPEPQRKDGGRAEGEDSVSSVSLELMPRDYGAEKFNPSDFAHQGCGAITHFMARSRSSMWGPNQQSRRSLFLMVLDHPQWAQAI